MKRIQILLVLVFALPLPTFNAAESRATQTSHSVAMNQGEIRLDGRVDTVDSAGGSFVLRASSFTTPAGRFKAITPVKTKLVRIISNTSFSSSRAKKQKLSLSSLARNMPVTVVGTHLGDGKALPARLVILNLDAAPIVTTNANTNSTTIGHTKVFPSGTAPRINSRRFRVVINGRAYSGTVVEAYLDTVRIKIGLGHNRIGGTEPLSSMAKRHGALVGINGSYFQAYNAGAYKPPVMTLITNGQPAFTGNIGTTLGFTDQNEVRMDNATTVLNSLRGGNGDAAAFWPRVQEAVGCGPRLVTDGRIELDMRGEKFSDPKVLVDSTERSAVGVTLDRRLLLVTTSGTIAQLAGIIKALGAYQAMNLDGGASSGMWLLGSYLRSPGRNLSNCLLVLPR